MILHSNRLLGMYFHHPHLKEMYSQHTYITVAHIWELPPLNGS